MAAEQDLGGRDGPGPGPGAVAARPRRSGPRGLSPSFYRRPVVEVARELIGCLVTHGGSSGIIVETEAYHDTEPACHAYVGLTARTATLFGPPGVAYVYRSYGVHAMLNAVCEREGTGAAVLIRALEPVDGIELMRLRRGPQDERQVGSRTPHASHSDLRLCSGPGRLTVALGIELTDNGSDLRTGPIVISRRPPAWRDVELRADRRIGITKAIDLPWRFTAAGSRFVSRPYRPL